MSLEQRSLFQSPRSICEWQGRPIECPLNFPPYGQYYRDPENFEHPEVYDPERFSKENIDKIPKMAFLGFGEGPRLCIGKYFGVFQVKAALASVLSKYRVELSDKMVNEPTQSPTAFILHCDSGVWIKFVKR